VTQPYEVDLHVTASIIITLVLILSYGCSKMQRRKPTSGKVDCVSVDDAKAMTTALVSSRLDYCNSVLSGTSQSILNKLQWVQNAVARMVITTSNREHITPVLAELHWLPVAVRIDFKIAIITINLLITYVNCSSCVDHRDHLGQAIATY